SACPSSSLLAASRIPRPTPPPVAAGRGPPPCSGAQLRYPADFPIGRRSYTPSPAPAPSARLCNLRPGDLVHVGAGVVDRGFDVARITDVRDVLVFTTGSGISPIRSLIEPDFVEDHKAGISLFYGVRNL
ncbi:unnamed protein product, partial [Urochloa humidicola]